MGKHNDTRQIRSVSRRIFWQFAGFGAVLALGACVQIAGITKPTLLDESQGGAGGSGGEAMVSVGTSSSSSGVGGSSNSTSGSSSSSSTSSSSSGGMACMNSGDCPNPANECESISCVMGMCVNAISMSGKPCAAGVCDGNGTCVECVVDGDCVAGGNVQCFMGQCITCTDGMKNGDETGVDCGGSACKKCDGDPCAMSADCKSSFCADGVCCNNACTGTCKSCGITGNVGICSNIPLAGTDNSPMCGGTNACDGNGSCKLKNGEPCNNNSECVSNNCGGAPKMCVP